MGIFTKQFFRHNEELEQLPDLAGKVIQDAWFDRYVGLVITFTDGSRLALREMGQAGWLQLESEIFLK